MDNKDCAALWRARLFEHIERWRACMGAGDVLQARQEIQAGDMALCRMIRLMKIAGEPISRPPPLSPLKLAP